MNEQQHILSAFDRDLEAIKAHIMKMGGMVEASILVAAKSFDTRDVELAADVCACDKAIDQLEIQINDEAAICGTESGLHRKHEGDLNGSPSPFQWLLT